MNCADNFGNVGGFVTNLVCAIIGANFAEGKADTRKNARDNHLFKFLGEDSARLERGTVAGVGWAGFFSFLRRVGIRSVQILKLLLRGRPLPPA